MDDKTAARIEQNANIVRWCVHVLGPDDVYAAASHADAVEEAKKLNNALWSRDTSPDDVLCFAFADTWPWSDERHAADLSKRARSESPVGGKVGL